jgi:hypothetical protein
MGELTTNDLEQFDHGISFEALSDALNNEIARHLAALNTEPDGPDAQLHDMAAAKLIEAQENLDPDNVGATRLATLIISSYRDKIPVEAR